MQHRRCLLYVLMVLVCLLICRSLVFAGITERVSVNSAGEQGNHSSGNPAISGNGRFVAFVSGASNLVAGDTSSYVDAFVHDRLTTATERVSVSSAGEQGNGSSYEVSISANGRFIAYVTSATNLAPGQTSPSPTVVMHDRVTGATELVSQSTDGHVSNYNNDHPSVSADGRYVAFASYGSNLAPGGAAYDWNVFVRDRVAATTETVNVAMGIGPPNGGSGSPAISGDGRFVAFESSAWNLVPGDTNGCNDVFVRDRLTGTTERVSVSSTGEQGSSHSPLYRVDISADGRFVAFASWAPNLVLGDTNRCSDIFVHDRATGTTERVSVSSDGEQGNNHSGAYNGGPSLSADGRLVSFHSDASNLVPGDTNGVSDVFVHDRLTGVTERVSVSSMGEQADGGWSFSSASCISDDGRCITFDSDTANLVPGDTNSVGDVFVHDRSGASDEPVAPYPTEDSWSTYHHHRGQLHAHYMPDGVYYVEPDGQWTGGRLGPFLSPRSLLEAYLDREYDFCAVTEHQPDGKFDRYTWPQVFDDPGVTGIVSMKGSAEDTQPPGGTHILGIGFAEGIEEEKMGPVFSETARLESITSNGGLAIAAHPDAAQYHWDDDLLEDLRGEYDGIEIYNYLVGYGAFLETYKEVWQETEDESTALRAAAQARFDQSHAVERWDPVLQIGDARSRSVWGTAGDDFTPYWLGDSLMDHACVVVWTESLAPDREEIKEALQTGRFYACKGGSGAPEILAYWVDPETRTISIKLPEAYRVTFVRGRRGRRPVKDTTLVHNGDGTCTASYRYLANDLYVRTEVRDERGNTSWLQPIWIDKIGGVSAAASMPAGRLAAADAEPLVVHLEGAELTISLPQSGVTGVDAALVPGDQRPSAPPTGHVGLCYEFTPDVALDGVNALTLEYLPDSVRGYPASALAIYRYDAGSEAWQRLDSSVDEVSNSVTAAIARLGVFTVSAEEPDDVAMPSVSIMYPAPDGNITEPTIVTADATDDQGVVDVQILVDGWLLDRDEWGGDGWTATLDPANYTPGTKVLSVIAEDGAGNAATAEIPVSMAGPMLAPVVMISSPAEAEVIWGDLVVTGAWSGQLPMSLGLLTLDHDPVVMAGPSEGPFEIRTPILPEQAGAGTVGVTGFDIYGNRATAAVSVVLKVFTDIPMDHWARGQVYAAACAGVVQGYPDGAYHPEYAVTRDQMAVYISRAFAGGDGEVQVPTWVAEPAFTDVPADHWAYRYIEYCAGVGLVQGYPDGSYHPDEVVNRGQMAVYVARSVAAPTGDIGVPDLPPDSEPTFTDVPGADYAWEWCWKYVEYCAANGVAQGYWDGTYRPENEVTRDQMAVYVARAFELPM